MPRRGADPRARAAAACSAAATGTVLGVTYKDFADESRKFERELKLTYPSLRDDKLQIAPKFGTSKLPETFVLDRRGRVVAISRGQIEEPFLTARDRSRADERGSGVTRAPPAALLVLALLAGARRAPRSPRRRARRSPTSRTR